VLRAAIEAWSSALGASEAVAALVAAGVPAAEIQDMAEALTSPHAEQRGLLQETRHPLLGTLRVPEQPAHFGGVARGGIAPAPSLDAHRHEILAELGGAH
jgi:CoA:oxalate CoA-transferase